MTPAERVVVEAAIRWRGSGDDVKKALALDDAVDALLAERANLPGDAVVEITWAQVVEGDQIYRRADGGAMPDTATPGGKWFTVTRSGPLAGTNRVRVNASGISRAIQPEAKKPVMVKRGATGRAVDNLGAVLWSGVAQPEIRDVVAALVNDPVTESEG